MREIGCCQLGVCIPLWEFAEFPLREDHLKSLAKRKRTLACIDKATSFGRLTEICSLMITLCLTRFLCLFFLQYSNGIPDSQGSKAKRDPALTTLLQALHLLWNLWLVHPPNVFLQKPNGGEFII